jgi:integrase
MPPAVDAEHMPRPTAPPHRSSRTGRGSLVFTTGVGTALEPRNVNRARDAVCTRAGTRCRVHDLRHAAASLAFAEGASVKEVQEMLRHSRESTTSNIYVHLLKSVRRGTADKMDGVLRRVTGA